MIWIVIFLALYLLGGWLTEFAIMRKRWLGLEWFYAPTRGERLAIILGWPCVVVSGLYWKKGDE